MVYKLLATCCAICCLSTAAFAAKDDSKCTGKTCGGKQMGPTVSGDRPLVMEPKDNCKGTVKCVNNTRTPNGNQMEMTVNTPNGEKKVLMNGNNIQPVKPGDQVEVQGRNVEANGQQMMMGEQMQRQSSNNTLNPKVNQPANVKATKTSRSASTKNW